MHALRCAAFAAAAVCLGASAADPSAPAGVHASWSASGGLYLTWSNINATEDKDAGSPRCVYTTSQAAKTVPAWSATYTDKCDGPDCTTWKGWVRTVEIPKSDAEGSLSISYHCGDDLHGWSREFVTKTRRAAQGNPLNFIFTADVGANSDAQSIASFLGGKGKSYVDKASFMLVAGDIAYANGVQSVWDDFSNVWEPVMSAVPTLFSPGNHDGDWVFGNNYAYPQSTWVGGGESGTAYSTRLPGPGPNVRWESPHANVGTMNSTSYWWAASQGGLLFIATSGVHKFEKGSEQYAWLEAQLQQANTAEARKVNPWVVVTNHYPMYCTIDDCFCGNYTQASREMECEPGHDGKFLPGVLEINAVRIKDAFEELLLKYDVDLFLSGHEHAYERTRPVANFTVPASAKTGSVFQDPGAPLHVMAGTGGGGPDTEWRNAKDFEWTVVRSDGDFDDTHPFGFVDFVLSADRANLTGRYINVKGDDQVVRDTFTILKTL
eukprot:TRINITY_DN6147_c0_g7_i1.p1 TRINITY_DN6147_c0_g7~~TRINITY_DN6147_c0_g7_i1.p1  ORF type:complete len:511 (+),score=169.76 TRINITY_DN6147_c0_g7_i1:56-1534(+)